MSTQAIAGIATRSHHVATKNIKILGVYCSWSRLNFYLYLVIHLQYKLRTSLTPFAAQSIITFTLSGTPLSPRLRHDTTADRILQLPQVETKSRQGGRGSTSESTYSLTTPKNLVRILYVRDKPSFPSFAPAQNDTQVIRHASAIGLQSWHQPLHCQHRRT